MTLDAIVNYVNSNTPYKLVGICSDGDGARIVLQAQRGRWPFAGFSLTLPETLLPEPAEKAILLARTVETVQRLDFSLTH